MKQIKCEICGSTEIKKTDDSTFICQSCGVQYTKDEVQKLLVEINGKVKIDHSEEIKNTIKRAEQFEESGDHIKAKEYYNKALDLDANNETIQKKYLIFQRNRHSTSIILLMLKLILNKI